MRERVISPETRLRRGVEWRRSQKEKKSPYDKSHDCRHLRLAHNQVTKTELGGGQKERQGFDK